VADYDEDPAGRGGGRQARREGFPLVSCEATVQADRERGHARAQNSRCRLGQTHVKA